MNSYGAARRAIFIRLLLLVRILADVSDSPSVMARIFWRESLQLQLAPGVTAMTIAVKSTHLFKFHFWPATNNTILMQ